MSVWTVKPQTRQLDLQYVAADGKTYPFSVTVKKFLTIGEQRKVVTAGWRGMTRSTEDRAGGIDIDWRAQTFARTEAYLTDWSLTNDDGSKIPITRDGIESLTPDVFDLIEAAINAHVEAMEQEKKANSGSQSLSATSA